MEKRNLWLSRALTLLLALGFSLIFCICNTPLGPIIGSDNAMYLTMGTALCRGYAPYTQIFDHKGPLLFLLQMLPQAVSGGYSTLAVFLMEFVFLFACLRVLCAICRTLRAPCLPVQLAYLLMTCTLMDGGNLNEEYANLFTLLGLLLAHLECVMLHRLSERGGRKGAFLCVHGGLWLALTAGMVGSADFYDRRAVVGRDKPTRTAYDRSGRESALAYTLQLREFKVDRNPANGTVEQYEAELAVDGEPVNLRVNHPFAAGLAEDLYLVSYDTLAPQPRYCIVQVVRQPAKYLMVAGIALLMLGVAWRLLLRL